MHTDFEDLKILRMPEVLRLTGLGRTSIYKMMAKGEFPRPVSLSPRTVGWKALDVRAWLLGRKVATSSGMQLKLPFEWQGFSEVISQLS